MPRIASRFDEKNFGEKCPRCLTISIDFLDLGENCLACFFCGCMFIRKSFLKSIDRKALLEAQKNEETDALLDETFGEVDDFSCKAEGCGHKEPFKSLAGLKAHQRGNKCGNI